MAVEKTEAVLVMERRPFVKPKIEVGGIEIVWRKHLIYLGVQLDNKLKFRPHFDEVADKEI